MSTWSTLWHTMCFMTMANPDDDTEALLDSSWRVRCQANFRLANLDGRGA